MVFLFGLVFLIRLSIIQYIWLQNFNLNILLILLHLGYFTVTLQKDLLHYFTTSIDHSPASFIRSMGAALLCSLEQKADGLRVSVGEAALEWKGLTLRCGFPVSVLCC